MKIKNLDPTATGEKTKTEPSVKRPSTGPRSDAGNRRSSRNAIRHGIFTDSVIIAGESVTAFRALVRALKDDLGITGATADILIEKLAVNFWRQARLYRAEGAEFLRSTHLRDRFLKEQIHDLNLLESMSSENHRADSTRTEPSQACCSEARGPSVTVGSRLVLNRVHEAQRSNEIACTEGVAKS
jgi:hypothetical protein